MSENYGKIYEAFYRSSIMEESVNVRFLMISLIVFSDKNGVLDATPEVIARLVNLSVDEVLEAIEVLERPDPKSRTPDCDGRRIVRLRENGWGWKLVNKEKYRAEVAKFDKQEYQRKYMRHYRKESAPLDSKPNKSLRPVSVSICEGEEGSGEKGKREMFDSGGVPIPSVLAEPDFLEVWEEWRADRKDRRKPITERAAKQQLRTLCEQGKQKAMAGLRYSIANGYQGVFFPPEPSKASKNTVQERLPIKTTPEERYKDKLKELIHSKSLTREERAQLFGELKEANSKDQLLALREKIDKIPSKVTT